MEEEYKKNVRIIGGNSHPELAKKIASYLGVELTGRTLDQFANTEVRCKIHSGPENNLRGRDVVIIQTGCSQGQKSVNDYLMETFILIDACKRSGAKQIIVVLANYPYAREDKKIDSRTPISAKLVADLLVASSNGVPLRVMTVDLHAAQISGFFNGPSDNLWSSRYLGKYLSENHLKQEKSKYILVSPDEGGTKRMYSLADQLKLSAIMMHKKRSYEEKNLVQTTELVGDRSRVEGKIAILVDDMCDTAGTICRAADTLVAAGVKTIKIMVVHPILSGPAMERLFNHPNIDEIIVTNTVPLDDQIQNLENLRALESYGKGPSHDLKISVVDLSGLLGEAIKNLLTGGSISELFKDN